MYILDGLKVSCPIIKCCIVYAGMGIIGKEVEEDDDDLVSSFSFASLHIFWKRASTSEKSFPRRKKSHRNCMAMTQFEAILGEGAVRDNILRVFGS